MLIPPLSDALLGLAIEFLQAETLVSPAYAFHLFNETEATETNSRVLHNLMAKMVSDSPSNCHNCQNCQQFRCINGQNVTHANLKVGAKVIAVGGLFVNQVFTIVKESPQVTLSGLDRTFTTTLSDHYKYKC